MEDVRGIDEIAKQKNQGIIDKLMTIENTTKEYYKVKQELDQTVKNEGEAKIQLTFYSEKSKDFESTLEKTSLGLERFFKEIEKV